MGLKNINTYKPIEIYHSTKMVRNIYLLNARFITLFIQQLPFTPTFLSCARLRYLMQNITSIMFDELVKIL